MTTNAALAPKPAPDAVEERSDKMPSGIWFIVSNEFAERFCFYGINAILTLYMAKHLHFTDAKATSWQSLFKSAAYFFPLLGAIISDVFWGKFRTIMIFSLLYAAGCAALALFGNTPALLAASLFFVALGTGGIKPCVSTNVGDQFTAKNQHLIERAFSWFYMAINAGSSISIFLCPVLLDDPNWGPRWAFGLPAMMMVLATMVFLAGRNRYAHVPPAGREWLKEAFSTEGLTLILRLAVIYFFVGCFWALWDQSNGNTWTLQASSSLVDKHLAFGWKVLPAQVQVVNGLFILLLAPVFSYVIYPLLGKLFKVTPLRKIGMGLFVIASSFLIIAWIEKQIQNGQTVSVWWQFLAYAILTGAELMVSVTALEFSYKQAPLRMKSVIMALFLLSTSLGNVIIAAVNSYMVKPLAGASLEVGDETWVKLPEADKIVVGQKIDVTGKTGVEHLPKEGKPEPLSGTFLVAAVDAAGGKLRLMDAGDRGPVRTSGTPTGKAEISTYSLVGPAYFYFFFFFMCAMGIIYIPFAMAYKEKDYVRT